MSSHVEIYLLNDDTVIYVKTELEKFDGSKIYVKGTPLLRKYGKVGDKVHFRYDSFVLPTRIIGLGDDYYILEFPTLHPEKPVGERRSIRVRVPKKNPIRVKIDGYEKDMHDISETGFSVFCNIEELDHVADSSKSLEVSFILPNIEEEIHGTARIANIREIEQGKVLCGYELFLEDADMVKVRFYIYERIKEILQGKE